MHFLSSSSVCVLLPRYFFGCARIKLDINGIALYRIAYKKYIDISYKLDMTASWHVVEKLHTLLKIKVFQKVLHSDAIE